MSTATKDYPSGGLRVSDADRDRAIAELSEHFQAGRLTAEELAARSGRLQISMFGLGTVLPSGPPEIEATLAAHDEWVAAGCPGARSHEDVMAELLGSGQ